jgi:hypothetical protein
MAFLYVGVPFERNIIQNHQNNMTQRALRILSFILVCSSNYKEGAYKKPDFRRKHPREFRISLPFF